MKEILKEVFQKINWTSTIKSVTDKGTEKLVASALGATICVCGTYTMKILNSYKALASVSAFKE